MLGNSSTRSEWKIWSVSISIDADLDVPLSSAKSSSFADFFLLLAMHVELGTEQVNAFIFVVEIHL
jgi:hypothetical protein